MSRKSSRPTARSAMRETPTRGSKSLRRSRRSSPGISVEADRWNRSGVRATCPDCHVPHEWTQKIARKMQASKEVWGHLFGSIDTRDRFVAERRTLAEHEWARFKSNNSLECRNCHSAESM